MTTTRTKDGPTVLGMRLAMKDPQLARELIECLEEAVNIDAPHGPSIAYRLGFIESTIASLKLGTRHA